MNFAIRVDASNSIGTGHVVRCLALAIKLKAYKVNIVFICKLLKGNLIKTIHERGFPVFELDEKTNGPDFYWEQDALQCINIFQNAKIDCLIVDHYSLDFRWEKLIKSISRNIVVIDDLADRKHTCDMLVDQNWFGEKTETRYISLLPAICKYYLGPKYALLGPDYEKPEINQNIRDGAIKSILVFLGGSDPDNQTSKVLNALSHPSFSHIHVDVVLGINHKFVANINSLALIRKRTKIFQNIPSLAPLMNTADLMISGGGVITWEKMCIGLPSIVISIANNQIEMNKSLMEAGYINYIGHYLDVTEENIILKLQQLLSKKELLKKQSKIGKRLVDGLGINRISRNILDLVKNNVPTVDNRI